MPFVPLLAMASRAQENLTPNPRSPGREIEVQPQAHHPFFDPHTTSIPVLEPSTSHGTWGLATYSHDRGQSIDTRSFSFRDDQVRSVALNRSCEERRDEGRQSDCTSFDGFDSVQSPDHIRHCYTNTNIDHSASVFNGDISRAYDPSSAREHHIHGGSVKNNSRLVNGDLDRDTFLAFFCRPNDGVHQEGNYMTGARRRRQRPASQGRNPAQRI